MILNKVGMTCVTNNVLCVLLVPNYFYSHLILGIKYQIYITQTFSDNFFLGKEWRELV